MYLSRILKLFLITLLLLSTIGCQQRKATTLLGEWVGRPDTAQARAERESLKYGDQRSDERDAGSETITDWQQADIDVKFNFVSRTQLEMSLADGSEPHSGTWRVLETSPTGCAIEVETNTGPNQSGELRRFQLEMDERDGTLSGFVLTETGADRQLGALYFRRSEQAE